MKRKRIIYKLLFILTIILSCSDNEELDECIQPKFEIPILEPVGNEDYLNLNSDEIFNQDSFYSFHINIPGENLNFLDSDPTKEEYTEAMLIFKNDTLSPIGLRYKGSIGSFDGYLSNGTSGFKQSTKLSMKLKINWLDKSNKFYGIKKLQFHSMNNDQSMMKERLGYWLYNQFGIEAPRCVHAKVFINNEFIGVFAIVENIDGRFVDYHFDNDGNIIKDVWPITPEQKAVKDSLLLAHLKTNEEEGDVSNFAEFSRDIENASNQEIKLKIESWFDTESLIKNMVVNHTIQHSDEAAFNFKNCNQNANLDDCFGGNIFWFSDKINRKVHLIPWDLDEAEFGFNENILNQLQINCDTTSLEPIYNTNNNTITYIDKLKCGFFQFETEYAFFKNEFDQTIYNSQILDAKLEKWQSQIEESVIEASSIYEDAVDVQTWKTELEKIKNWN